MMSTDSPEYRAMISRRLQDADVSPTQQRLDIAQILFARPQHLSADQVLNIVNAQGAVVSKATVYNTLGLFARKGLVREVIVDPTKVFYDSNTTAHHHFYNIDTGTLADIEPDAIGLDQLPALPEGTEAEAVDVIIRIRHSK